MAEKVGAIDLEKQRTPVAIRQAVLISRFMNKLSPDEPHLLALDRLLTNSKGSTDHDLRKVCTKSNQFERQQSSLLIFHPMCCFSVLHWLCSNMKATKGWKGRLVATAAGIGSPGRMRIYQTSARDGRAAWPIQASNALLALSVLSRTAIANRLQGP